MKRSGEAKKNPELNEAIKKQHRKKVFFGPSRRDRSIRSRFATAVDETGWLVPSLAKMRR
jgi:hypothetical protein